MKRFKEARKEFERGAEGLASALHHNAEVPRRRQHEAEEAAHALQTARTLARARALDYVLQVWEGCWNGGELGEVGGPYGGGLGQVWVYLAGDGAAGRCRGSSLDWGGPSGR